MTPEEQMSPAEQMAGAMTRCFDLEHKPAIGMAISMVAAYYLDVVVGGREEHRERGIELFNATVRAYLRDRSALDEIIRRDKLGLH